MVSRATDPDPTLSLPLPTTHSPIGIGVQGLADAFIKMRYPFESPEAMQLNRDIFEALYYGAVEVRRCLSFVVVRGWLCPCGWHVV